MAGTKSKFDNTVVCDRTFTVRLRNKKTGKQLNVFVTSKSEHIAISQALYEHPETEATLVSIPFVVNGQCAKCKAWILTHSNVGYETQTNRCVDCRRIG
jgi:hypothetical protein